MFTKNETIFQRYKKWSMQKTELFFGSSNPYKIKEVSDLLPSNVDLKLYRDFPKVKFVDPEETGDTLLQNAIIKAKSYYEQVQMPCFSEDSGLEVKFLGGKPGVRSARFAGKEKNSQKNNTLLLEKLKKAEDRSAQFKTVIAYYDGKVVHIFQGVLHGKIAEQMRGKNGFAYDSLFIPEGEKRTMAEMLAKEKNKLSHRAQALKKFIDYLTDE